MNKIKRERNCVYCGKNSVTKEDFFGRGVRKLLNPQQMYRRHQGSIHGDVDENGQLVITDNRWRSGPVASGKLRIACKTCNGGWMSIIQSQALKYLNGIIRGTTPPLLLSKQAQSALASWAAMVVMSFEYRHPPTIAVPQADRDFLRENRKPPNNWHISMGLYLGRQETAISHISFTELLIDEDLPHGLPTMSTAQCTTFVIGNLLFHAYSSNQIHPERLNSLNEMVDVFGLCRLTNTGEDELKVERIHNDQAADAIAVFMAPTESPPYRSLTGSCQQEFHPSPRRINAYACKSAAR